MDYGKQDAAHGPIYIDGDVVERVSNFGVLGFTLSTNLN